MFVDALHRDVGPAAANCLACCSRFSTGEVGIGVYPCLSKCMPSDVPKNKYRICTCACLPSCSSTSNSCTVFLQVLDYSTVGCRRTWGPASPPGIVLNSLDSSRFTFLSAIKAARFNAVQSARFARISHTIIQTILIFNFLACSLKKSGNSSLAVLRRPTVL